MLTNRRVLAAKIESVEGTAETLGASDGGILAIQPKVDVDIAMNKRTPARATLSKLKEVPGGRKATITFRAEMKGAGSAYSASVKPALGIYLQACGFDETIDTTSSAEKATYTPASTGTPSLTIGCYEDGVIKKLRGCRGNVKFAFKNGEVAYADFTFAGVWDGLTNGALLEPTYESTVPPVFLAAGFTVGGYSAVLSAIDIDMANVTTLRHDASNADGYLSAAITSRDPGGKIDPEMVLAATYDFFGLWKAGTSGALNIGNIGDTQYNRFKITAPAVVYRKVADEEREGIAVAGADFQLADSSGDDEISIEFN